MRTSHYLMMIVAMICTSCDGQNKRISGQPAERSPTHRPKSTAITRKNIAWQLRFSEDTLREEAEAALAAANSAKIAAITVASHQKETQNKKAIGDFEECAERLRRSRVGFVREAAGFLDDLEVVLVAASVMRRCKLPEQAGLAILQEMYAERGDDTKDCLKKSTFVAEMQTWYPYLSRTDISLGGTWTWERVARLLPPGVRPTTEQTQREQQEILQTLCGKIARLEKRNLPQSFPGELYLLRKASKILERPIDLEEAKRSLLAIMFPRYGPSSKRVSLLFWSKKHIQQECERKFTYLDTKTVLSRRPWTWKRIGQLLNIRE